MAVLVSKAFFQSALHRSTFLVTLLSFGQYSCGFVAPSKPSFSTTVSSVHTGKNNAAFTALNIRASHAYNRPSFLSVAAPIDSTETEVVSVDAEKFNELGGCTIGDTRGATMLLEDVSISRGSNQIIDSIEWRVENGERWGIVGPNGAGKSTLLGAITGTIDMDPGSKALVAPKTRVGYLKQTAVGNSTRSVFDEVSSSMVGIQSSKKAMDAAIKKMEDGDLSEKTMLELDEATTAFTNAGGYNLESTVETILKGLGFRDGDSERPCSEFSGGWQMRIGLAKLLLSAPSLLLLDEPSNHLDSSARDWLGNYLSRYDGTIILVSHDINLLTACTNSIAEVCQKRLQTYVSVTYDTYLEQKEFRAKSAQAEYERNMAEAARLQAFVDRFGASATKAASAQSRVKMLEKMKKEGKLTPPPVEVAQGERFKPTLRLPEPPKAVGEVLLSLEGDCDIGYYGDEKNGILVKGADLQVKRGMKLILRGKNGAGKSTLVKALTNELVAPRDGNGDGVKRSVIRKGDRVENDRLSMGTFTQDLAQQLPLDSRAIDIVLDYARVDNIHITDQEARATMGMLGLSDDKPLRKVSALSGGEKARVALSMFSMRAHNLILLDEPSNHLDVECVEALSDALSVWGHREGGSSSSGTGDGALVVVSHDRSFCESVGFTHVGTVKDGRLIVEERDLRADDWDVYDLRADDRTVNGDSSSSTVVERELTPEEKAEAAKRRKDRMNAPKKIKRLEKEIEKAEAKVAALEEEMMGVGNDVEELVKVSKKKEKEEASIERWMKE